jgi:hypothetical protein
MEKTPRWKYSSIKNSRKITCIFSENVNSEATRQTAQKQRKNKFFRDLASLCSGSEK